jgi:hypothetical protein
MRRLRIHLFPITLTLLLVAVSAISCADESSPVPQGSSTFAAVAATPSSGVTITPIATKELKAVTPLSKTDETASYSTPVPPPTLVQATLSNSTDPVLLAAGDIAVCGMNSDEATARLLESLPGTIATLGDDAYPSGAPADFANCYAPTWGRLKGRTRPAPGNHEYGTAGATGYFGYFGAAAGPAGKGYYSYDLGAWHVVSLNSEIAVGTGSPQLQWLLADLAAHRTQCTLAYWHQPRFSSGPHGSNPRYQPLWQALYDNSADVVLNGHDHDYERFAPEKPDGKVDPLHGIREFVVGTGGATLYPFLTSAPNSEVRNNTAWGILKLTLHKAGYNWEFISITGEAFTDSGSANCH